MSKIEQHQTGFILNFGDPVTKDQYMRQLADWAGLDLGPDEWGNIHSASVLSESQRGDPVYSLSVGQFLPSYLTAAAFLKDNFSGHFPNDETLNVLLAGALGGVSAHDALGTINAMSLGRNNNLNIADINPGVLPTIARRGGAYEFVKADLLDKIPGNQDIILANILLGYILYGCRNAREAISILEQFAINSFQALNQGGALIMVEDMPEPITALYLDLLTEAGFKVYFSPATRFITREKTDQFFASTQTTPPSDDVEQVSHQCLIIAVKDK